MKKFYLSVIAVLAVGLLTLLPLANRPVRVLLNDAESRVNEEPARVLELLDSISYLQARWGRGLRARFALLYTRAQDKSLIDVDDDSLIVRAVDYYRTHGDHRSRAMAYYYYAVVHHNAGDIDGAMEALVKAQLEVEECDDSYLQGLIYSELGNAYYEQNTFGDAIEMYTLAVDAFERCGHKENMFIALNSKGMAVYLNKQINQALPYLEKALSLAEEMSDIPAIMEISATKCYIKLQTAQKSESVFQLKKELRSVHQKYYHGRIPIDHYPLLGKLYFQEGDIDSSKYYLKEYITLKSERELAQTGIYAILASVKNQEGQYKEAYEYEKMYSRQSDSLNVVFREHEVRGLERKYKNEVLKDAYKKLKFKQRFERICMMFILFVFLIGIWFIYHFYQQKRAKEQEMYDISIGEFRRYCEDLEKGCRELKESRNANEKQYQSLLLLLEKRVKDMKQISGWATLYEKSPDVFYQKIKDYFLLSENTNRELVSEVLTFANIYCFEIIDYLRSICPALSSRELCYCGLVCLGFAPESIRILFNHTNVASIYTIRNKIREKLELKKSSFNLEKHIQDLLEEAQVRQENRRRNCE
ncbi:tetratricopeptide repeat protein [uncultured Alistipes sp.]|uniref:tetratricopeptide repeat protein n=1 Tax=uncultured Alistipes sp. TaxID=538949 RepID=UPI0032B0FA20